jgi:hypothetical protein
MQRDHADRQEAWQQDAVRQEVVRLAGYGAPSAEPSRLHQRDQGVRRLRRVNNWVLAALFVGVGATSAAFAHVVPTTSSAASSSAVAIPGSAAGTGGGVVQGSSAPSLSQPVAVSSGSSVAATSTASAGAGGSSSPAPVRVVFATRGQS